MQLEAGSRATVQDTMFSYNTAVAGSVTALRSTREYVDSIHAAVWFQDCHLEFNREAIPSLVASRTCAFTNTGDFSLPVKGAHCVDLPCAVEATAIASTSACKPDMHAPRPAHRQ